MAVVAAVGGGWEEGITGNVAGGCWEGITGIVGDILKDEMGMGLLNPIETGLGEAWVTWTAGEADTLTEDVAAAVPCRASSSLKNL